MAAAQNVWFISDAMLTRGQVNPNGSGTFPRQDSPPAEKDSHKTLGHILMPTTRGFISLSMEVLTKLRLISCDLLRDDKGGELAVSGVVREESAHFQSSVTPSTTDEWSA
ncbi:hypothetical protein EYF80_003942 [Liparis tanakae]|uniref:Uncharacterized protein n=1 Tax=Liparis tanakae TaxID=230148 RepID=A0A4Z2J5N3_9TELE|nr:hypothetical protein EYF80_003942 [Liparis tanakae]